MKATQIPAGSPYFWIRGERRSSGEVWFFVAGTTKEAAESELEFCKKQWPEIDYSIADYRP